MPRKNIVDAGPLVAFLVERDEHHAWAARQFRRFESFVVCEAVIAEACARLNYFGGGQHQVLRLVNEGVLEIGFSLAGRSSRIESLMEKYAKLPMDFADACLVTMTEETRDCLVITTDKADFTVYRRFGRDVIPTLTP